MASGTISITDDFNGTLYVGSSAEPIGSSGVSFTGHLDDVRVTKGVARYTGTFTPATEAFPDQ